MKKNSLVINDRSVISGPKRRVASERLRPYGILPILLGFCLVILSCGSEENPGGFSTKPFDRVSGISSSEFSTTPLEEKSRLSTQLRFPRIVAFGDSLTAGLGVSPDESYPEQLERWLGERGFFYEVTNAGVSGETSAGGLRRVEWILKSQPSLVILELGANDGLRGHPLNQTYKNLKAIILRLKAEGVIVVLAGMRIPPNYGQAYTQEFSGLYKRLAEECQISLIPFFLEGVAARPGFNQGDGIHPTAEGYRVVVQNVGERLVPILREWEKAK